jgi:hypothetical protein
MDFASLSTAIRTGIGHKHCVLCGTALNSHLDELPCPHWFLMPGSRGFRNRKLAPVFELYDLVRLVEYLKIAAASGPVGERGIPWRPGETDGVVGIAIPWGRRRWAFSYDQRDIGPDGRVRRFELAISYDEALVDKAQITVDPDHGRVAVKPLVQRRRAVAPAD